MAMIAWPIQIGDELIDVNGQSLIGVRHKEAIRLLKSSDTLMVTARVKDVSLCSLSLSLPPSLPLSLSLLHLTTVSLLQPRFHLIHRDDPLSNPPDNFELTPHDFDIDAELIPSDSAHTAHGFVLKRKDEGIIL